MQVLDTAVHSGPENLVVEFLGEGGQKIATTADLSDRQLPLAEAALVARQMMVQCAVRHRGRSERLGGASSRRQRQHSRIH